jgi:hypothetical protein
MVKPKVYKRYGWWCCEFVFLWWFDTRDQAVAHALAQKPRQFFRLDRQVSPLVDIARHYIAQE